MTDIERFEDIASEINVSVDGIGEISRRGLSRLCGVEASTITRLLAGLAEGVASNLHPALEMYVGQSLEGVASIPDLMAFAILKHYAGKSKLEAQRNDFIIGGMGIRAWMRQTKGWVDPSIGQATHPDHTLLTQLHELEKDVLRKDLEIAQLKLEASEKENAALYKRLGGKSKKVYIVKGSEFRKPYSQMSKDELEKAIFDVVKKITLSIQPGERLTVRAAMQRVGRPFKYLSRFWRKPAADCAANILEKLAEAEEHLAFRKHGASRFVEPLSVCKLEQ